MWNIGNIGILSRAFGLDAGFRKKIIQLFDLGYASRLRLVFLVSTGFFLCYALIGTTVEIRIEAEEEVRKYFKTKFLNFYSTSLECIHNTKI